MSIWMKQRKYQNRTITVKTPRIWIVYNAILCMIYNKLKKAKTRPLVIHTVCLFLYMFVFFLLFCLFVCLGFSSHSRIFHSCKEFTITGEGLQMLKSAFIAIEKKYCNHHLLRIEQEIVLKDALKKCSAHWGWRIQDDMPWKSELVIDLHILHSDQWIVDAPDNTFHSRLNFNIWTKYMLPSCNSRLV